MGILMYGFTSQDSESQSLAEADTWRQQTAQFQEEQAALNRVKQELEAEVERHKQVGKALTAVRRLKNGAFDDLSNSLDCCQELQYVEEEQNRAKSTLQSRVKDREDEIQKLRNQVGLTASVTVQF